MARQLELEFFGAIGPVAADRRTYRQRGYHRHGRLCASRGQFESLRGDHHGWWGGIGNCDTVGCLARVEREKREEGAVKQWWWLEDDLPWLYDGMGGWFYDSCA